MSQKKPVVIVSRKLPEAVETRMMELFNARLNPDDVAMDRAALIAAAVDADVLVPTVTDVIDREIIASANPNMRLIANFGAGVDHIDLPAARERGITVTNTPGVLTDDTADMTMALILATPRRLAEGERCVRAGAWRGWTPTSMMGHRITGKRLGILGMGRIGQAVARRARAFGLSIHYHNRARLPREIEGALEATWWPELEQMLPRVDFLSVNCPLNEATRHILSAERLALLKPDSYVVNTARGEIIDEDALASLLESGRLAGAGLDVYEEEPTINPRLLGLENVVLLPHMSSSTIEGRVAMGERVIINIRTFIDGHTPPDRVLEGLI